MGNLARVRPRCSIHRAILRELGGVFMNKDNIATELNDLIFSGDYDLDDLQDIIGDGDLAEYI